MGRWDEVDDEGAVGRVGCGVGEEGGIVIGEEVMHPWMDRRIRSVIREQRKQRLKRRGVPSLDIIIRANRLSIEKRGRRRRRRRRPIVIGHGDGGGGLSRRRGRVRARAGARGAS